MLGLCWHLLLYWHTVFDAGVIEKSKFYVLKYLPDISQSTVMVVQYKLKSVISPNEVVIISVLKVSLFTAAKLS